MYLQELLTWRETAAAVKPVDWTDRLNNTHMQSAVLQSAVLPSPLAICYALVTLTAFGYFARAAGLFEAHRNLLPRVVDCR
mgnify:CR=1 FL=1